MSIDSALISIGAVSSTSREPLRTAAPGKDTYAEERRDPRSMGSAGASKQAEENVLERSPLRPSVSSISTFRELEAADSSESGPKILKSTLALVALNSSAAPSNARRHCKGGLPSGARSSRR